MSPRSFLDLGDKPASEGEGHLDPSSSTVHGEDDAEIELSDVYGNPDDDYSDGAGADGSGGGGIIRFTENPLRSSIFFDPDASLNDIEDAALAEVEEDENEDAEDEDMGASAGEEDTFDEYTLGITYTENPLFMIDGGELEHAEDSGTRGAPQRRRTVKDAAEFERLSEAKSKPHL